eukprot:CAMPEP_0197892462 /NCGR_PEP_ID=MMETSP1439-20131203/30427_1 /TAXON_ID=66791 /ORGANISM="Gonyaulax spinifera, Strain CCMP409" /LENGTH=66 /DNA_ID=CAMNT_0043512631 /DNA_START=65 /DNA_END=262 /DNA_ORIENTATION=+
MARRLLYGARASAAVPGNNNYRARALAWRAHCGLTRLSSWECSGIQLCHCRTELATLHRIRALMTK